MKTLTNFVARTTALAAIFLAGHVFQSHAAPGQVDLSFDPGSGVNGTVFSVVALADGKALVGGGFTTVRGAARSGIARLNSDGSADPTFNPGSGVDVSGPNNGVTSIAVQTDEKILIAGYFNSVDGSPRSRIARLNSNGSLDTSFNPGSGVDTTDFGAVIRRMALQPDGKALIAGSFKSFNGTARTNIARLNADGSLDETFNVATNGFIHGISVQTDGKIIIVGIFGAEGPAAPARNRIVRLNANGSLDESFDPGPGATGPITCVAAQEDGKILIGGFFTSFNGTARNRIARLNANGSLDSSFVPGTDASNPVNSLALQADGKALIGGYLSSFGPAAWMTIARLNADGSLDTSFEPGGGATVTSISIQADGKALVGRTHSDAAGTKAFHTVARLNPDGSKDTSFDPGKGIDDRVNSVAVQTDGKVLIGGSFNWPRTGIARLNEDGTPDASFNPSLEGSGVNVVALQPNGKVLLGGYFGSVTMVRLNPDGSLDDSFIYGASDNAIYSIALQPDGKILIGGYFDNVASATALVARRKLARLNPDGYSDSAFDAQVGGTGDFSVYSVALQTDGKILIGGDFTSVRGTGRRGIARLNANGALDTTFNPTLSVLSDLGFPPTLSSIVLQPDGKALISGWFERVNGTARTNLARLNANGSLDTSFNPGPYGGTVALQADGKVLSAGFGGAVRLNANGSLDTTFHALVNEVSSVAIQADGKILIGGNFGSVKGIPRNYLARLHADYLPSRLEIGSPFEPTDLRLTGEVGLRYVLEYTSALTPSAAWTELPSLTLTNSPQTVIDSSAVKTSQRFYRARPQ